MNKIKGEKQLRKNLSAIERKLAPRAMANSLNRTGTKVRQQAVKDARAAGSPHKAKQIRKWIRIAQRAKAPDRLTTQVERETPRRRRRSSVSLSEPFIVHKLGGLKFRRAETMPAGYRGKGFSDGRPVSSGRNLPIIRDGERSGDVRKTLAISLKAAGQRQMKWFLPGEFRKQLDKQLAKIRAKQGRASNGR